LVKARLLLQRLTTCDSVARCLTKNMAIFVHLMANFWQNNFDNGNVIGIIDFSILKVFYFFAIYIFSTLFIS